MDNYQLIKDVSEMNRQEFEDFADAVLRQKLMRIARRHKREKEAKN